MMVGIDMGCFPDFETDLQIVEAMVTEQSVFCLPGKCFNYPDYFRIVLTVPQEMLVEACKRIQVNTNNPLTYCVSIPVKCFNFGKHVTVRNNYGLYRKPLTSLRILSDEETRNTTCVDVQAPLIIEAVSN